MAGVWIRTRKTKDGANRYLVEYRLGGREAKLCHGGSFKLKHLAKTRAGWIAGEIAARRVPDLGTLHPEVPRFPLLPEACDSWRASRIDVVMGTRTLHQVALDRVLATELRHKRLDEISVDDAVALVAELHGVGYKRETIKKSRDYLAMVVDHYEIAPNPARDKRVKLPRERKAHVPPPLAEHVERVAETVPRHHVLPLLIVDECGPRVNELATAQVGDLDEHRKAIRVRWTVEKNDRYRHLELPDDLFAALLATLPSREDRDLEAPLFPDLTDARLRTAITKACKATGTPHFSPHGLRRRRGSLHYKRTGSLADVAELLGDTKRVAAEHYVYALTDYREVDRTIALARAVSVA
ncbi:MAG TPA: site-specific integrase [Gaiellaceae bacterium]|jgi:integrase